jgi:hypothetical protein
MIDAAEAVRRAQATVEGYDPRWVILSDQTREEDFGWVFFYDSPDPTELLAGNAPLVVFRDTGEVRETGTALPTERYLASIREEWMQRPPGGR